MGRSPSTATATIARRPVTLVIGTDESPEFDRHTREFHAALTAAGEQTALIVGARENHFEIWETAMDPYGGVGRAALAPMGLA